MRIIIYLGILLMPILLLSKTIVIKDSISNRVLTSAFVYENDTKVYVKSNSNGEVIIDQFENLDSINIFSSGYKKRTIALKSINNGDVVKLKSTVYELDEIVMSANKWEQAKIDLSSRVESINKDVISFRNPQTSADLIGQTDYVYVQKSQMGGGSPMIRGFSTNRVLLVVDGIRMNNAIFRSGNLQNVISLDANAIENSEVLFGSGSVMYGSDAIGGVMDFHTLSPRLNFDGWKVNGNALVRTNSANLEKTGHVDFNIANDNVAFLTSFSMSDYENMKMGKNGNSDNLHFVRNEYQTRINGIDTVLQNPNPEEQVKTAYSQFNIMQKIKYKVSNETEIEGAFHYSETSNIPRYDRLIEYKGGKLRDATWEYGPQIWSLSNLKLTNYSANSMYDLVKLIIGYQTFEESRITRGFGKDIEENRIEKVGALSVNLDFDKSIDKLNLAYGFEYVRNNIGSSAFGRDVINNDKSLISTRYPDGSDWTSIASYFTGRYKINEKFLVNFGLRYSQFLINSEFDDTFYDFQFENAKINKGAFSGSFGAVYKFNEKFHTFVNLSTGFRAPNIDDIAKVFDSRSGIVVIPNPNLNSEIAYNAETGIAGLFFEKLYFDLSVYYTSIIDVMSVRNYNLNGLDSIDYDGELLQVQAVQNLDEAYIYGVQAGVKIELPNDFELSSKINFQKGEEYDGTEGGTGWNPLRHAAPIFGSTKLTLAYSKLKCEFFTNYNGSLAHNELAYNEDEKRHLYSNDENGNAYYQGWITFNLRSSYSFTDYLTLYVGLDNLSDIRYMTYSSGVVSPARSINASLNYKF